MAEAIVENRKILIYYGKKHIYKYYNFEYKDDNMKCSKGYYDEHGKYYRNVAFNNEKSIITCKNCGHRFYWTYNKFGIHCPKCYHTINIDMVDTKIQPKNNLTQINVLLYSIMFFISAVILLTSIIMFPRVQAYMDKYNTETTVDTQVKLEPVYIEKLQRYCEHIDMNTYYDDDTGCYFKYNVQVTPSQWYYYFSGVSEKYDRSPNKQYGWMVYNTYNKKWQVNTGDKIWEDLKENDYSSKMWYFEQCTQKSFE